MAQAGYTPISLYYSTTSTQEPTAGNLVSGELAINIADGKLFYKNSAGNVRLLSIGYGSSSVTPTNGGVQYGTGTALALTAAGSSGQILRSNGAAAPTWADLSTLGVNTISFGTTGLTPNSATAGAVTVAGTLVTANGGTGLGGATPFTANGVLYASSASALTSGSALTFDGTALAPDGTGRTLGTTALRWGTVYAQAFADGTDQLVGSAGTAVRIGYGASWTAQAFAIGGSEQMRLTSTGLKVGTTSDFSSAKVVTDGGGIGILNKGLLRSSTNGVLQVSADPNNAYASSQISFDVDGSTVATFDSSGNLGLGVTPSAWGSGQRAIQTPAGAIWNFNAFNMTITQNAFSDGTEKYIGNGFASKYNQNSGIHVWSTAPSGTAGNAITFSQVMTLDASGNLGIGTSSPINNGGYGGLSLNGTSGALFSMLTNGTESSRIASIGDQTSIQCKATTGYITFVQGVSGGTERARITSGGDLLVGTTSTGYTNSNDFKWDAPGKYLIVDHESGVASGTGYILFGYGGGGVGSITQNGTTGVLYNITSDYRLKNVIGSVTGSGERIDALEPVDYTWKADGSTARGFLAHKFQEVYPNSVTGNKDAVDDKGEPIYQAMQASSSEVIADLVAEIQSLRQRVALLEGN